MENQRLAFVGGLHKSGTSLLARCIATHPLVSSFRNTGVPEDEGQHLQSVYLPASAYGGPGKFGFDPLAHLTESSPLVSRENRARLRTEWGRHWDIGKTLLLEKSPPNLIRARFLQALFPEACFVFVMRHPLAVACATQKWSRTSIQSLIEHWLACHEIFTGDLPHLRQAHVVRYEELVEAPQRTMDGVFSFLGLDSVACELDVRPDVNAQYVRRWLDKRRRDWVSGESSELADLREYEGRTAALGYELNAILALGSGGVS